MSRSSPKTPRSPDHEGLSSLGATRPLWDELAATVAAAHDLTPEWKHYGARHGWQLKLVRGRRSILYLIPKDGYFVAATALDDAAVRRLHAGGIPARVVSEVEQAKRAPEGRPARVEVRTRADVDLVHRLVALKVGA